MKKIMITLALVSAIASIDMIHASAPAAAAAGAGVDAALRAKKIVEKNVCLADMTPGGSEARTAVVPAVYEMATADADAKGAAEPKEFTVDQAMKFIQESYDSAPLSLEDLKDMIEYADNQIQYHSLALMFDACEANGQKLSAPLTQSLKTEIRLPVSRKLYALQQKLITHSNNFFTNIYGKASAFIRNVPGIIARECRKPKDIEFLIKLRFFLEERAGIAALANALKKDTTKASTLKPAGGPALEEDTQDA